MGWLMRDRRGISWSDQTLASISTPPMHLLAFFGVVILWISLSTYAHYKVDMEKSIVGLKVFMFLLPVVLILIADLTMRHRWWWSPVVRGTRLPTYETVAHEGSSPWGVALVVALVLVMVCYQPSVRSGWFC